MFSKIENDSNIDKNLTLKEGVNWAKNAINLINSIYIN